MRMGVKGAGGVLTPVSGRKRETCMADAGSFSSDVKRTESSRFAAMVKLLCWARMLWGYCSLLREMCKRSALVIAHISPQSTLRPQRDVKKA